MLTVPAEFEPIDGEAGVLSLLAVRQDGNWTVVAGSLVTVPLEVANTSWEQWRDAQPSTGRPAGMLPKIDLGPEFDEEPFENVRVIRQVVSKGVYAMPNIRMLTVHSLWLGEATVLRCPRSGAGLGADTGRAYAMSNMCMPRSGATRQAQLNEPSAICPDTLGAFGRIS